MSRYARLRSTMPPSTRGEIESLPSRCIEKDRVNQSSSLRRLLLAIESSCDETAAAVIDSERHVLSSIVATQHELHQRFGGVVPEIASRAHLERILPVIDEALRSAGAVLADIGAIAVATHPGLVGSLLVGLTAAKTLASGFCRSGRASVFTATTLARSRRATATSRRALATASRDAFLSTSEDWPSRAARVVGRPWRNQA